MKAAPLQLRSLQLAGLAAVALFLFLIGRYYHPVYGFTALIQLDGASNTYTIPEFEQVPVYVHRDTGGYDGLYYAQIAYHPDVGDPALRIAIDNLSVRARRMLPATLAWFLSVGKPEWIARVYSCLNIAAWLGLALLLWRALDVRDPRRWLAWAGVMFSAGALVSVRLALTDLPALLLIAIALFSAERGRRRPTMVALAAAALTRETATLAVSGAWERPWFSWRNVRLAAVAWGPLALWLLYLFWRVGPAEQGFDNITFPIAGFVEKWVEAAYAITLHPDWSLTLSTLLATFGLTVQGLFFILRRDAGDRWWRLGATYTVLMLCLGTAVWEDFPGAATRVLLPMTLAFNVRAFRQPGAWAWLLLGNLTVFSGFVALRDPPRHPREMASLNAGGIAAIASAGANWYDREQDRKHMWYWTEKGGTAQIEAWPKTQAVLTLQFSLRALTPGSVSVRQHGREIARLAVGTRLAPARVPVAIEHGHAEIEFATDTPPTREGDGPGARRLGFALYDLRLELPDR